MSENQSTPTNNVVLFPGHQLDEASQEQFIKKDGSLSLYRGEFTGDRAGLAYYYPQFVAEEDATLETDAANAEVALAEVTKWAGPRAVLDAVNTIIKNASRARAGTKLPKFETEAQFREYVAGLVVKAPELLTPEDAINFKLGARELSVAGLSKLITKAIKDGKPELAAKYGKQLMDAIAREQKNAAILESMSS